METPATDRRPRRPGIDPIAAALLALALLVALAPRAYLLDEPFGDGFDGWLGGMYGKAARNLARDFGEMRGVAVLDAGPVVWDEASPHLHHPPLVWWLVAGAFRAFGVSEASARAVPALATLVTVCLVFAIGRRTASARAAGIAAVAFAALPMTAIYGGLVNYEPIVLALEAACWLFWLRFREGRRSRDLALCAAMLGLSILADWFGAFVGVAIALEAILVRPRGSWRAVLILGGIAVAMVAAILCYDVWIWPDAIADIASQARLRAGVAGGEAAAPLTLESWSIVMASDLGRLFGWPSLALAGAGIALGAWLPGLRAAAARAASLAIVGVLAVAVFPQASFTHEFLSYPLAVSVALGIGLLPVAAAGLAPSRALLRIAAWGAILACIVLAQISVWSDLPRRKGDTEYANIGLAIARFARFDEGVAVAGAHGGVWHPVGFYADRAIYMGIDSIEKLDALKAHGRSRAPVRYFLFVKSLGMQPHQRALADALAARYPHAEPDGLIVFDVRP